MNGYWRWTTSAGEVRIFFVAGRFHAMLGMEALGSYATPQQAADDLVGGHTFTPSSGADTSTLGLPSSVADWEFIANPP